MLFTFLQPCHDGLCAGKRHHVISKRAALFSEWEPMPILCRCIGCNCMWCFYRLVVKDKQLGVQSLDIAARSGPQLLSIDPLHSSEPTASAQV